MTRIAILVQDGIVRDIMFADNLSPDEAIVFDYDNEEEGGKVSVWSNEEIAYSTEKFNKWRRECVGESNLEMARKSLAGIEKSPKPYSLTEERAIKMAEQYEEAILDTMEDERARIIVELQTLIDDGIAFGGAAESVRVIMQKIREMKNAE